VGKFPFPINGRDHLADLAEGEKIILKFVSECVDCEDMNLIQRAQNS
jgi:hypothetical protein